MVDIARLERAIKESGMTKTAIAEKAQISRVTFQNRLGGIGNFTADEIAGVTKALRLTKAERDQIFFA